MTELKEGYVQIRRLDPDHGDVTEVVEIKDARITIKDAELIIDEDTNTLIDRDELDGKLKSGEVTKIRTMPTIAGGC